MLQVKLTPKTKEVFKAPPHVHEPMPKSKDGSPLLTPTAVSYRLGINQQTFMRILDSNPEVEAKLHKYKGRYLIDWGEMEDELRQCAKNRRNTSMGAPVRINPDAAEEAETILTYGDVRVKRELYAAKKAQLDYEKAAGRMVDVEAVERLWADIAVSVQKAVLSVPDRLTPLLIGETEHTIIHSRITTELKYALKNLSFKISNVVDTPSKALVLQPAVTGEKKND